RLRDRPRGPREGRDRPRLGRARRLPGHAGLLHGGETPRRGRGGADRRGGRAPGDPAAAIERGTWPGQRTVSATLGTIAQVVERERVGAPALIVIGAVAARREGLAWLERRPLHGRTGV